MDNDTIIKIINFFLILLTRIILLVKYENGFRFRAFTKPSHIMLFAWFKTARIGVYLWPIRKQKG